jgi:hypothetical protein
VIILVGAKDPQEKFECLKAPLIEHSPFFRNLLAPDGPNSREQVGDVPMRMPGENTVRVPEISARYFEVHRHWAYNSKLDCTAFGRSMDGLKSRTGRPVINRFQSD